MSIPTDPRTARTAAVPAQRAPGDEQLPPWLRPAGEVVLQLAADPDTPADWSTICVAVIKAVQR